MARNVRLTVAVGVVVLFVFRGMGAAVAHGNAPGDGSVSGKGPVSGNGIVFEVKVPEEFQGELNGRALILIADDIDRRPPYHALNVLHPIIGKTVFGLKAGDVVTFAPDDPNVFGHPLQIADIPPEKLYVQAFFTVYTKFERSDGSTIWGMLDTGGGADEAFTAYNRFSDTLLVDFASPPSPITLALDNEIPLALDNEIPLDDKLLPGEVAQQGNFEDTDMVKYFKIKSNLLSEFWGHDMYIGANVLLPAGYDPNKKYATLYYQDFWPDGDDGLGYVWDDDFAEYWNSEAPDMVIVTFRDANPFFDTSYFVNSANLGPYGDAIVTEIIPALEERFGLLDKPWARLLGGGGAGGWGVLALQVFYPELFGGVWAFGPDSVDFNYLQLINIYEDMNAYELEMGWLHVERPACQLGDGNPCYTIRDERYHELAAGGFDGMNMRQWSAWNAVFGPQGENDYPQPLWDPITGVIDPDVAVYWRENYDLNHILQRDWAELGSKLVGKLHLRGADMDHFYANLSQYELTDFLESTTDPYYEGYSVTEPRATYVDVSGEELIEELKEHMLTYGPDYAAEVLGIDP